MSAIASFFKNKTVFLTGGTGFIGKLLIDHLLRKTEPRRLYLLIREKKGEACAVRKEKLFKDVVFNSLRVAKPDFLEKIEIVSGDLSMDNLGIADEYMQTLWEEVEVVIHGGATVALNDCFKPVIDANLKGSLSIITLCHKIRKLQSFVLVSTAYSCCPYPEIKEEYYDVHITSDELLNLAENLTEAELKTKSKEILGEWPNPYTLCKALVENAVKNQAKDLPVAIIRPSIIMGTYSEPVPGWIDNYYGPTGIISASAAGITRIAKIDPKSIADVVPGDKVASFILAAAYKTSLPRCSMIHPIYNFVGNKETRLTWKGFLTEILNLPYFKSLSEMIWKSDLKLIPNPFFFEISAFIYNVIPLFCIDLILKFQNKKPRLLAMYKKVRSLMDGITFFGTHSWDFPNDNTIRLWNELSSEDRRLFNFNTKYIEWPYYIDVCVKGMAKYLLRKSTDSQNSAH